MKFKSIKIVVILLALAMLFAMVSAAGAEENEGGVQVLGNFGFVPNSWDASVSKVDLVNFTEVARYYTASREGVDIRSWRTNRIAMDAGGNAWVLNTGTDAFRYGPSEGLQGQVVRIQGDTEGLANTHEYQDPVLEFNTDDAVQVFDVGEINDMPRAIAVDSDGYIWVGFYGSGELHKYLYDENGGLELVEHFSPVGPTIIRYYEMKFAPNGDLFISSRSSTPSVSGDFGIWRFDGENFYDEQEFNSPYGLLISPEGVVYATSYNTILRIRATDGVWSQVSISGAQNLRGMSFDDSAKVWIASTTGSSGGDRVCWYDPQDLSSGFITLIDGNTPVGVGKDAAGNMWAICRTDNEINGFIEAIDPINKVVIGSIEVGPRPYAYGDFTQTALIQEELTVTKTAKTSFTREHFWDIDKSVETENGYTVGEDIAKIWLYVDASGDENATWFVNVSYEGYEDSDFMVCGEITINNTATLDANITSAVDKLAGNEIQVNWVNETGDPVEFPYILEAGKNLTGTYCEVGYFEGFNNVTITTEKDFTYDATAEIIWGDPDTEFNETVTVKDISDLFGEVDLGSVTAPYCAEFNYTKNFAWAEYGVGETRGFAYENTATIVETGQYADAILKVNVQGYDFETAYAKGDDYICFIPTFANWGWTNPIGPGEYTWDLWAGAAQCDTSKGTLVGNVTVVYGDDGNVTVEYNVDDPNILEETHVYAGYDMFPQVQRGSITVSTVAPGQYYNYSPFDGNDVYVIAHAVVGILDVDFGPEEE